MHFMCTYRTLIQPWFSSFVSGVCDTSLYFCFRKLRGKSENFCNTEKTATPKAVRQIQNRQSSDACSIPGFMLKYCGECRCICWMHKVCEDVCHVGISQEAWSKDTHNYAVKRLAISSRIFYLLSILQKLFYNTCVSRFQIPRGATFWKQQRIQKGFVVCLPSTFSGKPHWFNEVRGGRGHLSFVWFGATNCLSRRVRLSH